MVQPCEQSHLLAPLPQISLRPTRPEALDRYLDTSPQVTGPVHDGGRSGAEHRPELVAAGDDARDVSELSSLVGGHDKVFPPSGAATHISGKL
jgi:hypothetical protein